MLSVSPSRIFGDRSDPRLEQPATSSLWYFPEMARFLESVDGVRLHTWMKCFGHDLPKPSVLMTSIEEVFSSRLRRNWSKKVQARLEQLLKEHLTQRWSTRRLWAKKWTVCKTAMKFHVAYKARSDQQKKCYHYKSRSKNKTRVWVNGGKDLRESGVYTPAFCRAVISAWMGAQSAKVKKDTLPQHVSYQVLWGKVFRRASLQQDQGAKKTI